MKVVALVCLFVAATAAHDHKDDKEVDAASYLQHYGYFNPNAFDATGSLENAVKEFQGKYGLKVTGKVDEATKDLMNTPRCSVPDTRSNGYYKTRGKWNYKTLTYNFYTRASSTWQRAIADAFAQWSRIVPLTFRKVSGRSHLRVYFQNASGRNANAWAFAYFPTHGGITFNTRRGPWPYQKLYEIGTHEIGHALGLDHTNVRGAMMYPYWNRNGDYRMNRDDINGITRLYGRRG